MELPNIVKPLEAAENIVKGYNGPTLIVGNTDKASYSPMLDTVRQPEMAAFTSEAGYYGVLFHELTHSTGHKSRLDRKLDTNFGSDPYSREELVAELGASMLCAKAGIAPPIENSAGYIQGWLKAIKDDSKAIVVATGQAMKAAKFILGEVAEQTDTDDLAEAA